MKHSVVRFGILILQNAPWEVLRERFRRSEAMGFDVAWVADHFVNPYVPEQDWFEGWTLLGALAADTTSIRLGTLVSSITLRNPALLARAAMTADHISAGRIDLGIGAGGAPLDHSMTGIPQLTRSERLDRLEEAARILRDLLTDGAAEGGEHFPVEGPVVRPLPVQRPRVPLTIGALGPGAIRIAARYADTWNSYGVGTGRAVTGLLAYDEALAATKERVVLLDRCCEEEGRDPADIRRSFLSMMGYAEPFPDRGGFERVVEDFRGLGMQELSIYWPKDVAGEPDVERIGASLSSLRDG